MVAPAGRKRESAVTGSACCSSLLSNVSDNRSSLLFGLAAYPGEFAMKSFARNLLTGVLGTLVVLFLITTIVLSSIDMLTRKGIYEAVGFVRTHSLAELVEVLTYEFGGTTDAQTDPSYGRETVAGRGHAPWVMRSNLDDRTRVINLALAPQLWLAYDTQTASLYQLWRGDIDFMGAVYDYRHGPQPRSRGSWLLRQEAPAQWQLQRWGGPRPAKVRYLGHRYLDDRQRVELLYRLVADRFEADITETAEVEERDGQLSLHRTFTLTSQENGVEAIMNEVGRAPFRLKPGTNALQLALSQGTPIPEPAAVAAVDDEALEKGRQVILNADCVGCHSESHQVTGPSYARIAKRFRGRMTEGSVSGLANSIIQGSVGKWGQVPMPAHPDLSVAEARSAARYILALSDLEAEVDAPLDASGQPFVATRDYEVGPRLKALHPAFQLENLLPEGFEPKVGGMDFRADGKLLLASWDLDGAVFLVDTQNRSVKRIAEGLHEPLGLNVIDGRLFVLQKQELTELVDTDGDDIIDEYRAHSVGWPVTTNFHSFAFGLEERDGYLYGILSICIEPGGASCADQLPTQGKVFRIAIEDGRFEVVASGFRTPNGIGTGADGSLFVADNQGDWLPASKIVQVEAGNFYGSRAVPDPGVMNAKEVPPVVWLPQDEIGNSPTQPFLLTEGPYTGQLAHGDVYHGGMKRVYMERVGGAWQGAVMRFSAGFQGGVNRMARGPDGALYIGEIGNPPNWGELGKTWYGLERMIYAGEPAFELLKVNATVDGFDLTLTRPLAEDAELKRSDLQVKQWFYYPTEQYGGPKYDETELSVSALALSADRTVVSATVPGLKPGYVVYLALPDDLSSESGETPWTYEAWYTLNEIPVRDAPSGDTAGASPNTLSEAELAQGWELMFDGKSFGDWRNYGAPDEAARKWQISQGSLNLPGSKLGVLSMVGAWFGGGSGDLLYAKQKYRDFELSLEWKISENGNSGIFYFVANEDHPAPWLTGPEMQILHNEGHKDGEIPTHRAGDLYDMIAATPETVRGPGEWNQVLIRSQHGTVEHWLNGAKVVSYSYGGPQWEAMVADSKFADMEDFGRSAEGYIVLQDHSDAVWFRNLKIRPL